MIGVVLAAGAGKRMLPLTKDIPKALLPIDGLRTMLDVVVDQVYRTDCISELIIVVADDKTKQFKSWLQRRNEERLSICSVDGNRGVLGSFLDALLLCQSREDILLVACDNILSFPLKRFTEFAALYPSYSCVMYHEENDIGNLRRTGVGVIREGNLIAMDEKPDCPLSNYAIPPFYIYRQSDIELIRSYSTYADCFESTGDVLAEVVKKGPLKAFRMPGKRFDLGHLPSYYRFIEGI